MEQNSVAVAFNQYIESSSRWQRYRLARKTFKYSVYRAMEAYVLISFLLSLALPWISEHWLASLFSGNTVVVALLGLAHHAKLAGKKPWLLLAAAFEAFVLWGLYQWVVSSYLTLPYFWVFCVFVFVWRYWQRGENEVNWVGFQQVHAREMP